MKWFLFYPELYYFACAMILLGLSLVKQANPRRDYLAAMILAALYDDQDRLAGQSEGQTQPDTSYDEGTSAVLLDEALSQWG